MLFSRKKTNSEAPECRHIPVLTKRRVFWRRVKVFGFTFISTILATIKWADFIPTDVVMITKIVLIALFFLTFMWISLFFWSSLFGFLELLKNCKYEGFNRVADDTKLNTRTAILMPVYNESSTEVAGRLLAISHELAQTGYGKHFDFFILSDTTNPKIWLQEEITWLKTKELFPSEINLFYRHRPKNFARKSGNIEDFCTRWGKSYDFMLVLDADSLMVGKTIVKMAQLMEANPTTGIIQAPPSIVNGKSFFARLNQFAGKVYGPIVTAGLCYWQAWDGNYWGHNAIIRTKAFISSCGLPIFKGKAPFGGHILSHDFVEAALIRRAGWLALMLPELKGSYEESPPAILDFAARDRRWCQGNLQHLRILFSQKLHPISRIHFTLGIMSYLSSPLWFLFLTTGLSVALWRYFSPPVYFPDTKTLFPSWPVFDVVGTIALFALSMAMLFLPKILGVILILIKQPKKQYGGFFGLMFSLIIEILFSALVAPVMMLFQSHFVAQILLGLDSGWQTQNRNSGTPWKVAFRRHFFHTIIGIATIVIVYHYANSLFYWMLPITIGLVLSIPLSVTSSQEKLGRITRKLHIFVTPEEVKRPKLLQDADDYCNLLEKQLPQKYGIDLLLKNGIYLSMHNYLLAINGPTPDFENKTKTISEQKLMAFVNGEKLELSVDEERYCLYNPQLLLQISLII